MAGQSPAFPAGITEAIRRKTVRQMRRPHTSQHLSIAETGHLKQIGATRGIGLRNDARFACLLPSITRRSLMMAEPAHGFANWPNRKSSSGIGKHESRVS